MWGRIGGCVSDEKNVQVHGENDWLLDPKPIIVDSLNVILPFLHLVFPMAWVVTNYIWLARVLHVFCSLRHVKITDDPFDDTLDRPDVIKTSSGSQMQKNYLNLMNRLGPIWRSTVFTGWCWYIEFCG